MRSDLTQLIQINKSPDRLIPVGASCMLFHAGAVRNNFATLASAT